MKKKSGSRIGRVFKKVINVRAWMDYDRIKASLLYLGNGFKKMFIPQKQVRGDSFNEAVEKWHLTEKDLTQRETSLKRLSIFMLIIAAGIFIYAGYHLIEGNLRAMLISLVVMLIALTLAFRYHFWYFQIKERKLGCSFREWFQKGLMGEKK